LAMRRVCRMVDVQDNRGGGLGLRNLRTNGHPRGGPWRPFHCPSCQGYFLETHGTLFHGKQAAVERIVRVVACVAEGWGIRATARVFEVAPRRCFKGVDPVLEGYPKLIAIDEEAEHQIVHRRRFGKANRRFPRI
jgi:hypothetical protein